MTSSSTASNQTPVSLTNDAITPTKKSLKLKNGSIYDAEMCEWLFCPSDVFFSDENFNTDKMVRISPMANICTVFQRQIIEKTVQPPVSNADLIHIEAETNIYYFHCGDLIPGNVNSSILTLDYRWPTNYTFILWVKWEPNCSTITTFDSAANTPIVGSTTGDCFMGCASAHPNGWQYAKHTKMVVNEWQFVVAVGGKPVNVSSNNNNNNSKAVDGDQLQYQTQFFCGSLSDEPTFREIISADISGLVTQRIGNTHQGPGKVAYIKVLKCHLGIEQIVEEYHLSINEILGAFWSKDEYYAVVLVLGGFCFGVEDILWLIIHYCCRKAIIVKYSNE